VRLPLVLAVALVLTAPTSAQGVFSGPPLDPYALPAADCTVDPAHVPTLADLPAETQAQIASARAAAAPLATTEAARAAGYRPFAGTTPTMGQHWVSPRISRAGVFDPERPSILLFAPVDGESRLVGVSYSLRQQGRDPLPEGFDGDADVWHTHATPRGDGHVAMVHLWFDPALNGPFTDHNPFLGYRMAGLAPPPAERFATPEGATRMRHLALALGEAAVPFTLIERAEARAPALRDVLQPYRDEILALVPALRGARDAGDWTAYDALADEAIGHWAALRADFADAAPDRLVDVYLDASSRTTGCNGHLGGAHDGGAHGHSDH
jgi:hypothetical protein